jgi:two-component system chemotaxis response regulator CheB
MRDNVTTRVLVVDDSPSVRELLVYILGSDPGIEIVGCATDGKQAVRLAAEKRPDVITMDVHMPNLDGFAATRQIMQTCPTPIVILSGSISASEIDTSLRAIEAGALAMVQRPLGIGNPGHEATASALIRTVKAMAEVKVVRRWNRDDGRSPGVMPPAPIVSAATSPKLVLLGASTGGPTVLCDILAELPQDYALPVVIVQHMAAGFATGFAAWLSSASGFPVQMAKHGDALIGGHAYLAEDGMQIGVTHDMRIALRHLPPEHGMCPSVSYLFRSIPDYLRPGTVAVLLTGMGKDGAKELRELKEGGAVTVVQDRASAAVYGMPGEALKQDAARFVLSPADIGILLRTIPLNSAALVIDHG